MEASVVRIGNSRGFRLSKTLLERYNIKDKVELILEQNQIVIKPVAEVRQGWNAMFKEMRGRGDDKLLLNDVFEDENFDVWQ
jgi:antitoxin MazE